MEFANFFYEAVGAVVVPEFVGLAKELPYEVLAHEVLEFRIEEVVEDFVEHGFNVRGDEELVRHVEEQALDEVATDTVEVGFTCADCVDCFEQTYSS